jgi:hypothetical protein
MVLSSVWAVACAVPSIAGDIHAEDSVKAAFVLRFASYVDWPEAPATDGNFTIVVLGASEIAVRMQSLASGRFIKNRPVQVRRITSIGDAGSAQILYIGTDRRGNLQELLAPLAGHSVLVISDEERALDSGSIINLRMADQRVRFEVSLPAARRSGLRISSDLLSLAVRVQK